MKSLIQKLQSMPRKSVIVVGDIGIDEYIFGSVQRVSPEAPVPVVRELRREYYLGCAANTAMNCQALDLDVKLIGVAHPGDSAGQKLFDLLKEAGLSPDGIVVGCGRTTTIKSRVIAQNHHCLRIDNEDVQPLSAQENDLIIERFRQLVTPGAIVLLSDYAKGVITKTLIDALIIVAHQHQALVIADPKGPDFSKYVGIDYLKPNATEFKQMVQYFKLGDDHRSFVQQGRMICDILGLKGLIVTLGERGIHYISKEEEIFSPAFKREVFDLSGAGDTVFAYVAYARAYGLSWEDTLLLANKAASIAIAHLKTYAVKLNELLDGEDDSLAQKIVFDWGLLKRSVEALRQQGKRIVFTNGCFDLLHPGHVQCLIAAKKQGDVLIVALNTDASVRRLNKGVERPLNELEDRATILAALQMVDLVTCFDQDTPQEIIDLVLPDVLVKGGDYIAEDVVGYQTVTKRGGRVCIVPLVAGKSTTKLVRRAQSLEFSI